MRFGECVLGVHRRTPNEPTVNGAELTKSESRDHFDPIVSNTSAGVRRASAAGTSAAICDIDTIIPRAAGGRARPKLNLIAAPPLGGVDMLAKLSNGG